MIYPKVFFVFFPKPHLMRCLIFFLAMTLFFFGFSLPVEAADLMAGTTNDAIDTMKGACH